MVDDRRLPDSPGVARRLASLAAKPLNFELSTLHDASAGWDITDVCQRLIDEPPGPPIEGGSWDIAKRMMSGYEFADPSIVRAFYEPSSPLEGRNMLLKLQALGTVHLYAGVRVGEVYDKTVERDGRKARVWGWNYRTLAGHVEMGEMSWEVWKWLADGRVEFRVHSISRPAPIGNPIVRLGFHLLRGHERRAFLNSTRERMRTFTELAVRNEEH
jgi:uncharacterized protein (UPF0548 family)